MAYHISWNKGQVKINARWWHKHNLINERLGLKLTPAKAAVLVINSAQTSGLLGRCQKEILHCEWLWKLLKGNLRKLLVPLIAASAQAIASKLDV